MQVELLNVVHKQDRTLFVMEAKGFEERVRPQVIPDEMGSLEAMERRHIVHVIQNTSTLEEAARVLGINMSTLWRKRKAYKLDRER